MKNYLQAIRNAMTALFAISALTLLLSATVSAQDASTSYKGPARDPFTKYKPPPPPKRKPEKKAPTLVAIPSIQERIEKYKAQKLAAMNAQLAAPKPTTALLLSEFQITGIFRTPRGYAAMVEATPIKLSYVIYPGESFYDGQLVAIEENRLVFRRETRWTDGRREMAVETKPLRQANAVADSMTATKASSSAGAAGSKEEKAAASGNK